MSKAPYGYCPICHAKGVSRTRCMSCSSDTCENGHKYMAKEALTETSVNLKKSFKEWLEEHGKLQTIKS